MARDNHHERTRVMQLGYWAIRGLAQAARYMLEFTHTGYRDVLYTQGDGPQFSRQEWTSVKNSQGLFFANLPYLKDGETTLTESSAIYRYLARKLNLYGDSDAERANIDMVVGAMGSLKVAFSRLCYDDKFDERRPTYVDDHASRHLRNLEQWLEARDQPFIASKRISWGDFYVFEVLDIHLALDHRILQPYPLLTSYHRRIKKIPELDEYFASERFAAVKPINNKVAAFR